MDSVTGSTAAGEWLASGCGVPTGAASQSWLWSMFTVKMYRLQGWRTLSKLTQGLSSHVTSPVTTPVMTVGVHRQTSVRQTSSHTADTKTLKTRYDVVIIGAGHNGLVAAAYLQKAGLDVCVLERRHLVGGAAVTEEIVPGFKFSRASYVLSLFRPEITRDLELKKHGLNVYFRDPYSYTPLLESSRVGGGRVRSLLLETDPSKNHSQIAQFSQHDAQMFHAYEASLSRMVDAIQPLIDLPPVDVDAWVGRSIQKKWHNWPSLRALIGTGQQLGRDIPAFYEFLTAPAAKVLDKWFESEPLKATLATDACIGAMTSPYIAGSGYVLLHHVMGELEGQKGAWGYVKGGMGALSEAIAGAARAHGASIFTDMTVSEIAVDEGSGRAQAVVLNDGTEIHSNIILSNATAKVTFLDLLEKFRAKLPQDFLQSISQIDYTSPVAKINVAVNKLPSFLADPNEKGDSPLPQHRGTVHLNCERMALIHDAYLDALQGRCSHRPVIEMTIPSSIDPTLAPPGCHIVHLFVQYIPYTLAGDQRWTEQLKDELANRVFDNIEEYAPGFKGSIVGCDILTPPDLERIFGLTGGNIFQGAMSMDQLFFMRPTPFNCDYRTPLPGLYMCGAAAHPGGGVMGSAGRLAALAVLDDRQRK